MLNPPLPFGTLAITSAIPKVIDTDPNQCHQGLQPIGIKPIKWALVTLPGIVPCILSPGSQKGFQRYLQKMTQPQGSEHEAKRLEEGIEASGGHHRGHGETGDAHPTPEPPFEEKGKKAKVSARGMSRLGEGNGIHVGNRSPKAPPKCPEKGKSQDPFPPILPPGENGHSNGRQDPGDHGACFMAEVASNPPPNRERKGDNQAGNRMAQGARLEAMPGNAHGQHHG